MPIVKENGEIKAYPPFTDDDVSQLRAGDHVKFYGTIYTARDAAHRRMFEALDQGKELPMDVRGQVIYYVGPTPARPGRVIGSAGPTTAMRLDPFTPRVLGTTSVINFHSEAMVAVGFWLMLLAATALTFGPWLVRFTRESWANTGTAVQASILLLALVVGASSPS